MKLKNMKAVSTFLFALTIIILSSCSNSSQQEEEALDTSTMTDEELRTYANELAHKFIITNGHVDLPYRMRDEEQWLEIVGQFGLMGREEGWADLAANPNVDRAVVSRD